MVDLVGGAVVEVFGSSFFIPTFATTVVEVVADAGVPVGVVEA